MASLKILLIVLGLFIGLVAASGTVSSHHTGVPCSPNGDSRCLPRMDASAARHTIQQTQQLTYCLNSRASNYPNFRAQVREVLNNHEANMGVRWVEVPGAYETPSEARAAGCQVQHNMPDVHGCGSCAGWIHYLNWPVLIEYKWQLGYTSWHTTISHEVVHAYGLHEHYDDHLFKSHRNYYGYWAHGLNRSPGTNVDAPTVMDFGTGVWQMTPYDVKYACQSIDPNGSILAACGLVAPPPCDPCWDDPSGVWRWQNGWAYNPISGVFYNPHGWPEFSACNADRLRWSFHLPAFVPEGDGYFDPIRGDFWAFAPPC